MRRMAAIAAALGVCACASAPAPIAPYQSIHERTLTLDTHLDTPALFAREGWNIRERHDPAEYSQVDLPRMIEGGLDGGFWAIYTQQGARDAAGHAAARDFALRRATQIHVMVAANAEEFAIALKADDAGPIAASGKRVVFLSMENSYPIGRDISLMKTFYDLGVRMMGPVHFANNELGDSSTAPNGPEFDGLSPLGEDFVREANRLGIVLDASHASDGVLDDMLALSRVPIILSHSGVKAVFDHPRNIDDDRLRALAAKGGVIQMNALGAYLTPLPPTPERDAAMRALRTRGSIDDHEMLAELGRIDAEHPAARATFEDFMRHLLHALEIVGPDHVGIGADWDGGGGVDGLEDVADLPKITERLLAAGYTEEDVAKIWSGNVLRVLRAVEAHAARPAQ